ncbi:GPI mannosyltransferase 1 [Leucoagaricus sp. SymC.cos]|nr:GPI mannosyltransferase 1 [Leucoagaricus sp. SymC.cos]
MSTQKGVHNCIHTLSPYTRHTYHYTPLLALLLTPNKFLHPSFGKHIFAACDIINRLLIYNLLMNHILPLSTTRTTSTKTLPSAIDDMWVKATLYATVHLLNPMVFSISTRGSSESVPSLFIPLTLHALFNERWTTAALFRGNGLMGWFKVLSHAKTIKFAIVSAVAFSLLGTLCYILWSYPFLYESSLYHLHCLNHRHNFSPYFYPTYLSYPTLNLPLTPTLSHPTSLISILTIILSSPLTSFLPQLLISFISSFLSVNPLHPKNAKIDIPLALWLSEAYKLEFLGEDVFLGL